MMLGLEASKISARSFVGYCARHGGGLKQMRSDDKHGAQYLRFRHSSQSVAQNITLPDGVCEGVEGRYGGGCVSG